jgi:parallel beta-helix repeat protein
VIGSRNRGIDISHGLRIAVTGNTIYDGIDLNVRLASCRHTVLSNNTIVTRPAGFDSTSNDGVLMEGCTCCSFVGNIVSDVKYGDETSGGAVTLRGCNEVAVSSCQITDSRHRGIHLHDSNRCRISDNTIANSPDRKATVASVEVSGNSHENVIQNNAVTEGGKASVLADETAATVLNNTLWKG